jgi:Family of unknown function (DUF5343)
MFAFKNKLHLRCKWSSRIFQHQLEGLARVCLGQHPPELFPSSASGGCNSAPLRSLGSSGGAPKRRSAQGEPMPTSHPYISGAGNVTAIIAQLRRNFPQTVTSETVRKFGIASNNESYLVNMLAFLGL